MKKFCAQTEPGRVEFKDAIQNDVSLPVLFKEFAPAFDLVQSQ
jgi:hypothetical protein